MSRIKEHRPNGAAAEGGASVFFVPALLCSYTMNIHGYSLYIPYIFHIYFFLNVFNAFSLVCFLTYSVNKKQILIRLELNDGAGGEP